MIEDSLSMSVRVGIKPGFPYVVIDTKEEVEVSIGVMDRILHITFLGSVSRMDWIHNFMFWKLPYKRMKKWFFVHAGFLKIYKIARPYVRQILEDRAKDYDTVSIKGHSLGGAITALCLEDVVFLKDELKVPYLKDKIVVAVTSGAPRVFGALLSKVPSRRCDNLWRVRYKNDGIPRLPFALLGYKHVGRECQLGKSSLLGWLHPSAVYHHSVKAYWEYDGTRVDTAENNELFSIATAVYKYIYGTAMILLGVGLIWRFFL